MAYHLRILLPDFTATEPPAARWNYIGRDPDLGFRAFPAMADAASFATEAEARDAADFWRETWNREAELRIEPTERT